MYNNVLYNVTAYTVYSKNVFREAFRSSSAYEWKHSFAAFEPSNKPKKTTKNASKVRSIYKHISFNSYSIKLKLGSFES